MEQQRYHYQRKIFALENLERGVYLVQDLLKNTGKYLSYEEFKTKYNIKVSFIYYYQILSAIPKSLK